MTRAHGTLLLAVTLEPQEIGRRIAAARHRKGWTQLMCALEANVSPSSVARWESGKLPPVRELMRIAALLDIDAGDLVEDLVPTGREAVLERLESELAGVREAQARIEAKLDRVLADRPAGRFAISAITRTGEQV